MAEGQLVRVQPDIVEEVKQYEGGSFSEKLRRWRADYSGRSNDVLTVEDLEEILLDLAIDTSTGEIIRKR